MDDSETYRIFLDLAEHKDLYDRIAQEAKEQIRTLEAQIIFILQEAIGNSYGRKMAKELSDEVAVVQRRHQG